MPKKAAFVREYTNTTGTGTITLAGALAPGDQKFEDVYNDGDAVIITIKDGYNYEITQGVVSTGGSPTITRVRVLEKKDGTTLTRYPATGLSLSGYALVTVDNHHKVPDYSMPALLTVSGLNWLYSQGHGVLQGSSSKTLAVDRFYYCPFFNAQTFKVTGIACYVGTAVASSNVRMYIYEMDYDVTNGVQPGHLIKDAGAIASATTGDKKITFSAVEVPPWSFVGIVADTAGIGVRAYADTAAGPTPLGSTQARPVCHGYYDGTYGAAADPGNAFTNYGAGTTTPTILLEYTQ